MYDDHIAKKTTKEKESAFLSYQKVRFVLIGGGRDLGFRRWIDLVKNLKSPDFVPIFKNNSPILEEIWNFTLWIHNFHLNS